MSGLVQLAIHPSQFPENVARDLLDSLRSREVNHKFHYEGFKQSRKWLALHQAHSPSQTDPDCQRAYDLSFAAAAGRVGSSRVHVVGLGCGGGGKETRLLELLRSAGKEVFYTPSDVSAALVLTARQRALAVVPAAHCFPLVCDLASASNLAAVLDGQEFDKGGDKDGKVIRGSAQCAGAARLFTFFGMLPNFEPGVILPQLASVVRPGDGLLMSANLAPGPDYAAGARSILPLYDNALTRDWLVTFLLDLGVEANDGSMRFDIEEDPAGSGLRRVTARFHFARARQVEAESERFEFRAGDSNPPLFLLSPHAGPGADAAGALWPGGARAVDYGV